MSLEKIYRCNCGGVLKFHAYNNADYFLVKCRKCRMLYKVLILENDKRPKFINLDFKPVQLEQVFLRPL